MELALELADLADAVTLPRFRSADLVVATKPDLTPVSDADRDAEATLRRRIGEARPDDAIVGEEFGETVGAGAMGRRWILDPLDGTKNFVRGVPVWGALIALERDGEIALGVASAPALGRRWWAGRGLGAYADGDRIRVSAVGGLDDAFFGYDSVGHFEEIDLLDRFLELSRRCWRSRGFSDFWAHLLVAEGAIDVAVHAEPGPKLWDLAPLLVIVEEAGGRFTDVAGRRTAEGGSAVSSNGLLHDEVLGVLGVGDPGGPRRSGYAGQSRRSGHAGR